MRRRNKETTAGTERQAAVAAMQKGRHESRARPARCSTSPEDKIVKRWNMQRNSVFGQKGACFGSGARRPRHRRKDKTRRRNLDSEGDRPQPSDPPAMKKSRYARPADIRRRPPIPPPPLGPPPPLAPSRNDNRRRRSRKSRSRSGGDAGGIRRQPPTPPRAPHRTDTSRSRSSGDARGSVVTTRANSVNATMALFVVAKEATLENLVWLLSATLAHIVVASHDVWLGDRFQDAHALNKAVDRLNRDDQFWKAVWTSLCAALGKTTRVSGVHWE